LVPFDTILVFDNNNKLCGKPPQYAPVTLTFWPWKWWASHMWDGLPWCQF